MSQIDIQLGDPIEMEEQQNMLKQLQAEQLPGMIKSKWALTYKLKMDKAIEEALKQDEVVKIKAKTKGRFQI